MTTEARERKSARVRFVGDAMSEQISWTILSGALSSHFL